MDSHQEDGSDRGDRKTLADIDGSMSDEYEIVDEHQEFGRVPVRAGSPLPQNFQQLFDPYAEGRVAEDGSIKLFSMESHPAFLTLLNKDAFDTGQKVILTYSTGDTWAQTPGDFWKTQQAKNAYERYRFWLMKKKVGGFGEVDIDF